MANNSIYNKKEVPTTIHTTGCSMAETGRNDYDDFNKPLKPLNVIPEEKKDEVLKENYIPCKGYDGDYMDVKLELLPEFTKPSALRPEPLVTVTVPAGIHPIALLNPEAINQAWIILNPEVVKELRKFPYKFQQDTVAYGEFFRLENNDSFSLQEVKYFEGWRVIRECNIDGVVYQRPENPEFIIEMVME